MMTLDSQLAELADTPVQTRFLELANEWCSTLDLNEQRAIANQAYRLMVRGTPGRQLGAWSDLKDAVTVFIEWDLTANSAGFSDYLSVPPMHTVFENVRYALTDCERLA